MSLSSGASSGFDLYTDFSRKIALNNRNIFRFLNEKMPSIKHEQELQKFLGEIKKDVEAHNWENIFAKSSKKHYLAQFKAGIKPPPLMLPTIPVHYYCVLPVFYAFSKCV